jgi:hypothetical protein
MARRNWTPIPDTVLKGSATAELVLALPLSTRGVYLSMWIIADSHGRFAAGERSLRAELGIFEADMVKHLSRLEGLVTIYRTNSGLTAELVHSDCGLPAELVRRRGASSFPGPSDEGSEIITTAELVRTECGVSPVQSAVSPTFREEKRREEKTPPLLGGDQTRARMELDEDAAIAKLAKREGCSVEDFKERLAAADARARAKAHPSGPLTPDGEAFLMELAQRACTGQYGAGNHQGGFFAAGGYSDLEIFLRTLEPEALERVCADFWTAWDAEHDEPVPRKPAVAIDEWLVSIGAIKSAADVIALQIQEARGS